MPSRLDWRTLYADSRFVDRTFMVLFVVLSLLIVIFRERLPGWPSYLLVNAVTIAFIAALVAAAPHSRVLGFLHDWYPLLGFITAFEVVARLSLLVVPEWQDAYILRFEEMLFDEPPTVTLPRYGSPLLTEILELGYFSYYALFMVVGGALYGRHRQAFHLLMSALLITFLMCYAVYLLFPTEGPHHTLAYLHDTPLPGGVFRRLVMMLQKYGGVHGNAFPSSHVAAAIVHLGFAFRYRPRLGWWLTPLVVLLCIGAVYDRYHYFSDVPSGILFGLAAYKLAFALARRPQLARRLGLLPLEPVHS
jgi:membrane-associated phospholipid phosphatase